jgi:pimeloyl-ACP methyl ester carboxylesterase
MAAAEPGSRHAQLAHGRLDWIEAGPVDAVLPPLVLLHGIGSCAASWRGLLPRLAAGRRVLAWDAPGYAASAPLPMDRPTANDYADAVDAWLAAADAHAPVLLGHSLGALMAAALAARSGVVGTLLLASPAQGYATAAPAVREAKFDERMAALRTLGIEGMARERSARLCAPAAPAAVVAKVRDNMLQIHQRGYSQAAWMLANDHIDAHLAAARAPLAGVMCGEFDAVTPAEPSRRLAERHGAPFRLLGGLGHACYVEDPASFADAVDAALALSTPAGSAHARV